MFSLQAEELADGILVQLGADDAQTAHHIGGAEADVVLAGNEVKVDPLAILTGHDALGAQDDAVLAGIKLLQDLGDLIGGVLLGSLAAPGGEDLVGMVMMVMIMVVAAAGAAFAVLMMVVVLVVVVMTAAALLAVLMMMVVLMLMIVTAAAVLVMLMVMMLMAALMGHMAVVMLVAALITVVVMALVLLVVVLMLVVVVATAALLTMLMMVMVLVLVVVVTTAALLAMLMMMVLMMVMAAAAVLVMVMMVVMMLVLGLLHVLGQGVLALESGDELLTGQVLPGGGDDGGVVVVLADQLQSGVQLLLGNAGGTGQDDGGGGLNLVVVELTEVLHVYLDLVGVGHSNGVAQLHIMAHHLLHGTDDVGQLAHTGGLDDDAVRVILGDDLLQSLAEVAHQGAADAAGVHLGDVDAGILQEAAVNADLAELVLDQHQLLALVALSDQLLDESGLAGSQEAGINVNFCHGFYYLQLSAEAHGSCALIYEFICVQNR